MSLISDAARGSHREWGFGVVSWDIIPKLEFRDNPGLVEEPKNNLGRPEKVVLVSPLCPGVPSFDFSVTTLKQPLDLSLSREFPLSYPH